MFTKFPTINEGIDPSMGLFTDLDDWDILILLDIVIFIGNLVCLVLFTLFTVNTNKCCGGYIKKLERLDKMHAEKDTMEVSLYYKKMIIQAQTMAFLYTFFYFYLQ